jgi:hypothetical protein
MLFVARREHHVGVDSIWAPVVASAVGGFLGAAGGLGGSWLTLRSARQREDGQHRRQLDLQRAERLRQTYLDMSEHLDRTERWIDVITETRVAYADTSGGWKVYDVPLSPRVRLYCPKAVSEQWVSYLDYIAGIQDAEVGKDHSQRPAYDDLGREEVSAILGAVRDLRETLRAAMEELDWLSPAPPITRPTAR